MFARCDSLPNSDDIDFVRRHAHDMRSLKWYLPQAEQEFSYPETFDTSSNVGDVTVLLEWANGSDGVGNIGDVMDIDVGGHGSSDVNTPSVSDEETSAGEQSWISELPDATSDGNDPFENWDSHCATIDALPDANIGSNLEFDFLQEIFNQPANSVPAVQDLAPTCEYNPLNGDLSSIPHHGYVEGHSEQNQPLGLQKDAFLPVLEDPLDSGAVVSSTSSADDIFWISGTPQPQPVSGGEHCLLDELPELLQLLESPRGAGDPADELPVSNVQWMQKTLIEALQRLTDVERRQAESASLMQELTVGVNTDVKLINGDVRKLQSQFLNLERTAGTRFRRVEITTQYAMHLARLNEGQHAEFERFMSRPLKFGHSFLDASGIISFINCLTLQGVIVRDENGFIAVLTELQTLLRAHLQHQGVKSCALDVGRLLTEFFQAANTVRKAFGPNHPIVCYKPQYRNLQHVVIGWRLGVDTRAVSHVNKSV